MPKKRRKQGGPSRGLPVAIYNVSRYSVVEDYDRRNPRLSYWEGVFEESE